MNAAIENARRDDEDRLLRRLVSGDAAACRTIERWAREIVFFRGFGLPADDRDDVVQETVAGVWRAASRPGFELSHGVRALVRTIAIARCIDRVRRRRPTVELAESIPDAAAGPYEQALASDERARLRLMLRQLGDDCREIIRMHYFENLNYAEIAAREQRSESTMRVRMFNCIRALRKRMERGR
jgi:RNA polymerase sigma factor (sigma-70 family)